MAKLFGTDGIRGLAGEPPLDPKTIYSVGMGMGVFLKSQLGRNPKILLARDTRESGTRIEQVLTAGLENAGCQCSSAGIVPTPALAYLSSLSGADAGVMISASHNPYQDNGVKIFAAAGKKIPEELETKIEEFVLANSNSLNPGVSEPKFESLLAEKYIEYVVGEFQDAVFPELKLIIDCANGAAYEVAPGVFKKLGFDFEAIANMPDGKNINAGCGSLHLEKLRDTVLERNADLGIAFDGDADRMLLVAGSGRIIDGDGILWILTKWLLKNGGLKNRYVIGTVMSNYGLELSLNTLGAKLLRTPVGDKYVLEEMLRTGSEIGGEQSGHIIIANYGLIGDGLKSALAVLAALGSLNASIEDVLADLKIFPQRLINIPVSEKRPFEKIPSIDEAIKESEKILNGKGRIIVRYSGTENLARVMVEGEDESLVNQIAEKISSEINAAIGLKN